MLSLLFPSHPGQSTLVAKQRLTAPAVFQEGEECFTNCRSEHGLVSALIFVLILFHIVFFLWTLLLASIFFSRFGREELLFMRIKVLHFLFDIFGIQVFFPGSKGIYMNSIYKMLIKIEGPGPGFTHSVSVLLSCHGPALLKPDTGALWGPGQARLPREWSSLAVQCPGPRPQGSSDQTRSENSGQPLVFCCWQLSHGQPEPLV